MNLYSLTDDERRIICKQVLESLEFWLRRLIHDSLSTTFGDNYLEAKKESGDNLIKNDIKKKIQNRILDEPERYSRPIDASLLEHQIDIICNPDLFNKFFRESLKLAYPDGREEARTFLKRLEYPRNCLSHANPISVRLAERVVCYTNDVIDSLKEFYRMNNQENEFNVPRIIKVTDSFGNIFHLDGAPIALHERAEFNLRVGDTLTVEIEVDPTFDESEWTVHWYGVNLSTHEKRLVLNIKEKHVSRCYGITCKLTSNKTWHKNNTFDDQLQISYKVLPPL